MLNPSEGRKGTPGSVSDHRESTQPHPSISGAIAQLGLPTNEVSAAFSWLWADLISDHSILFGGHGGYIRKETSVAVAVAEVDPSEPFDTINLNGQTFLSSGIHSIPDDAETWYRRAIRAMHYAGRSTRYTISIVTDVQDRSEASFSQALIYALQKAIGTEKPCTSQVLERRSLDHAVVGSDNNCRYMFCGPEEHTHLDTPPSSECYWLLIKTSTESSAATPRMFAHSQKIIERLAGRGFHNIADSGLERKEVKIASQALPRRYRKFGWYLLSEINLTNQYRRAIETGDWQKLGSMMRLSFETQLGSGLLDTSRIRAITNSVDDHSPEILCGSRLTTLGQNILLLVRDIEPEEVLQLVRIALEKTDDTCPETLVLAY